MARTITTIVAAMAVIGGGLPAVPAAAMGQERDLVGARASSGESEMQSRGYRVAKTQGLTQYWWHDGRKVCVRTDTYDGRYQNVTSASSGDCGKGSNGGDVAAGVIAGAAVVGLIAALSSHHKNSNDAHRNDTHDSEYQRGYQDGLYGASYDRNDSEGYHEGFMAGESEAQNRRASNSRYVRGAPQASQSACMQRGDQYLNVPYGSTVPVSVYDKGRGIYEITVASGHYRARCTVDSYGNVQGMKPY